MLLAFFSVFALVAAGCGGGGTKSASSTGTSTTGTSTTGSTAAATGAASFAAYTQCMTSHGIPASALTQGRTRPTTGGTGGSTPSTGGAPGGTRPTPSLPAGVTQAQYQAAQQACRSDLPAGGFGGFGGANSAQLAAYRNCLQLHGVTLPAAGGGGAGGGQPPASGQTPPTTTAGSAPRAGGFGGLNTSDPTVKAALTACAALRPTPTQGSTTTSTTAA
jgi:hypothetical protein